MSVPISARMPSAARWLIPGMVSRSLSATAAACRWVALSWSTRAITADLLALGDWLRTAGCTPVAMEATGVYWQPVYNLLAETCSRKPARGQFCALGGECAAHQGRSWTQDGGPRRRMDRRSAAAWGVAW